MIPFAIMSEFEKNDAFRALSGSSSELADELATRGHENFGNPDRRHVSLTTIDCEFKNQVCHLNEATTWAKPLASPIMRTSDHIMPEAQKGREMWRERERDGKNELLLFVSE